MKRTSDWIFSHEIPSDVTVQVEEASFSLHKFPLVSKCGYIRKLVSESSEADVPNPIIELSDIPGGAEAFELAAKFCYGINFEMTIENIAMLRCVAEYLEMTEDYSVGNLVGRTDAYLNEVALKSLAGAVSILQKSEKLLPIAERAKLVSRCIDAIAFIACKESQFCSTRRSTSSTEGVVSSTVVEWWAEDLIVLRIDIFQRVLIAMMARGFKQYAIVPILMLYAQKSLRGSDTIGKGRKKIEGGEEHEKRVVLETIVSLLPKEKNAMPVSFLSMLLRASIYLETTVACRLDLEKRVASQLDEAVLDDLLIPTYSLTGETLFDVDTVHRVMMNYYESGMGSHLELEYNADAEYFSPPRSNMERVGKLMESYLAEIATDRNLPVSKFVSLAELIPEQSRPMEDGMYRAIDIYLKAHPILSEMERKKVCSVMDCQKLSREACAHAAQNDRLTVQTVVQVLFYEQQRLRDVVDGSPSVASSNNKLNLYSADSHHFSNDLSNLRRENKELKLELVKLKMKLKEIENSTPLMSAVSSPVSNASPTSHKLSLRRKSFMNSVSKKLARFYPFLRNDVAVTSSSSSKHTKTSKSRRHSVS
ncbi:BTB/POZ domain-containing protein SR1IP1 isoform X1 [Senna tora]|uniref:BTB/POZ domain-containing protein SR1IP1 isoform X1 n=1 Tax=Senna tora TaxID=362788 RepID=A0A834TYU7_9FABA|nr:BTB/POZ domain-containing protein SR1IP1 isoform X1 [Senna tora]